MVLIRQLSVLAIWRTTRKNQALRLQLLRNALIPSLTLCLTHNSLAERHHWLETANVTSLLCINLKRYLPLQLRQETQEVSITGKHYSAYTKMRPPPVVPEPAANQRQQKGKDGKAVPSQATPEIITVQEDIEAAPVADEDDNPENQTYLPATSIISTVLIAGMDAPTSRDARKDPYPALARVKKDAILPNRFRADIRECGMLAAGFGDLSSERAYFRSEVITCIRDDGAVFEAPLVAYAVGEDGKSGVRGRLVTKQGQYLARALTAGFLQAASQLFNVQSIPTISIKRDGDSSDATPYQQVMSSDALQGAAVSGVGGALNRLADFYMQMAGDLFPVIEIDPGRSVDFIVQKGVMLKFTRVTSKTQTVGGKK